MFNDARGSLCWVAIGLGLILISATIVGFFAIDDFVDEPQAFDHLVTGFMIAVVLICGLLTAMLGKAFVYLDKHFNEGQGLTEIPYGKYLVLAGLSEGNNLLMLLSQMTPGQEGEDSEVTYGKPFKPARFYSVPTEAIQGHSVFRSRGDPRILEVKEVGGYPVLIASTDQSLKDTESPGK